MSKTEILFIPKIKEILIVEGSVFLNTHIIILNLFLVWRHLRPRGQRKRWSLVELGLRPSER